MESIVMSPEDLCDDLEGNILTLQEELKLIGTVLAAQIAKYFHES